MASHTVSVLVRRRQASILAGRAYRRTSGPLGPIHSRIDIDRVIGMSSTDVLKLNMPFLRSGAVVTAARSVKPVGAFPNRLYPPAVRHETWTPLKRFSDLPETISCMFLLAPCESVRIPPFRIR